MAPVKRKNDQDDDERFKTKRVKSRKQMRKAERKKEKQRHHQNMLRWKERNRKSAKAKKDSDAPSEDIEPKKGSRGARYEEIEPPIDEPEELTDEQREIEYLEKRLLKNKKGASKGDVFQTLRKEFINDGFDDDLLDFLSEINHMAEKSKLKSKRKSTTAAASNDNGAEEGISDTEEDDADEEVDSVYGDEEEESGSYTSDDEDVVPEPVKKRVRFNLSNNQGDDDKPVVKQAEPRELDLNSLANMKKKQMGLINRISEGNFIVVVREVINIYNKVMTSGKDQTRTLDALIENICECTVKSIIENENSVISLVAIHTALICALCNTVGINVGYVYCHKLLNTLGGSLPILFRNKDTKQLLDTKLKARNTVMSFSVISELEMLDCEIIFHIIKIMTAKEITEHIAQVLMLLLRYTGHKMRSEHAESFQKVMDHFHKMLEDYKSSHGDITQTRLRFFQQEIDAFKISKERKPVETFDFLKNIIKGEFRYQGGGRNPQIDYKTLLQFSQAYTGNTGSYAILKKLDCDAISMLNSGIEGDDDPNSTDALLQKATALRLYSNCQKSTFIAIMGALNPQHAVERIMQIGIKSAQYTEVVYTIVHCLMSENAYNPYYSEVGKLLSRMPSTTGKRFTRANVCTMISAIEHLHEKRPQKCTHAGLYFGVMVISRVLEIRLLRFLKKEHMESASIESFLSGLFLALVTETPQDTEEHVIEDLLKLQSEEIFEALSEAWSEYLDSHCAKKVSKLKCSRVILEACRRIFTTQD
ncbi:uncharacterized protein BBOV_IV005820 [Babesia bovis T2Bo]|uniref:uncharacterized protein n=1 Tax=Babesia bovis T2Bo TaxID=484906 RepID=UPI001D61EBC8|nr:uncharacterized protein BBOV_IV005820 [Babesia bovis T2Bo]EDO06943.2 hypothetical protein BBOV_IV005820 [Babesia bovis T2Bo]